MILVKLRELVRQKTSDVLKARNSDVAVPSFDLSVPPSKIPGDLATNVVLMMSKKVGQAPHVLAKEILADFPSNPYVQKAEIKGAGFLNFWLTDEAYRMELESILDQKQSKRVSPSHEKVLVEFVSANPTGPLHIGHGRGAALGDSLVRILRHVGYDVTAEFYVNDSGGQIRNLGYSMEARVRELKGEPANFPEKGYKGSYVKDLAQEAMASGQSFDPIAENQTTFSDKDLAGFASHRILEMIKMDLEDFGVHFDTWFRESELHKKKAVQTLFKKLKEENFAYEQDEALWFRASDFGDEKDRVLQKRNDAPTYFAADFAYHDDKYNRGFKKLINIWGADHHGYAQRIKGALQVLKQDPESLKIVLNQLVSIKGGRLSKRAGDMITLRDVLIEVGRDAARFFFALRSPGAHFEFDLDLAKKQASDNPVFYVQYVHARCCSIHQEARKRTMETTPLAWKSLDPSHELHPSERAVILHLLSFDNVLDLCVRDFSNHHLTMYLIDLAAKFHAFYEHCYVLDEKEAVRSFRLDLVSAIRIRVKEGLELLGVGAPEKL